MNSAVPSGRDPVKPRWCTLTKSWFCRIKMMSSTKRTSATAVANQAAAARVVARVLDEGIAARWLLGGALSSGLTEPEILGVFAWCYLRTLV
jgi:hypothetical protein